MNRTIICLIAVASICSACATATTTPVEPGIEMEILLKSGSSWNGAELPAYPQGKPEISIMRATIPPGQALPMHMHPVINAGVLISGELTVHTEDGKEMHLTAGDPLIELVDTWHYGRNDGDVPAEIIVVYAGTADSAITVAKPPKD
jgi:quercetin dioxygenase-like cupin family protein